MYKKHIITMVTCLKTHGMFLLVESGIKQSCYSNYFSSMLVFSALKIPEISKSRGMLTFWTIWVPRNTISNVISEQSLMCVCFCQGFKEKRSPLGHKWSECISEDCHLITREGSVVAYRRKLPQNDSHIPQKWDGIMLHMGICRNAVCLRNDA